MAAESCRFGRAQPCVAGARALRERGLARLWSEGVADPGSPDGGDDAAAARLETELRYGIGVGAGVATPHAGFAYAEGGDRQYHLGTRLKLGPNLALNFQAQRNENKTQPERGVRLDLRLRW